MLGGVGFVVAVLRWAQRDFGPLQLAESMQLAIPSATFLVVGSEVLLASFFLGLLHLDQRLDPGRPPEPVLPAVVERTGFEPPPELLALSLDDDLAVSETSP